MTQHDRSLLTSEWYVVPIWVDCAGCGAQTRSAGIIVGPSSFTNAADFDLENDVFEKPWEPLEAFGLVEKLGGRTENVERFVVKRYHSAFAMQEGGLQAVCEHCSDSLPGALIRVAAMDSFVQAVCEHCSDSLPGALIRVAAMDSFVRLGQRRLLKNERLMFFSSNVVLTQFHGGTWIQESGIEGGGYSLLLLCDAENTSGGEGVVELWHSVERNDYAVVIKGQGDREMLRRGFSDDLEQVVADVTGLGLVLTQLHLAQDESPYCELARSLFLSALSRAGYQQDE
ncbi:hypothetical protein X737_30390 [Mesorhizobium sp. L48C026A00]|nr:hypothetical protein [Mesorhizobium sp. L48C026A00]ESZ11037.1 hypothetical protein X737_30390 [Mesorhizobium sp. L48C026A00]